MTKTYTLRERATGPSNVTAVAVAKTKTGVAGSLAIGTTFYYKQMCDGYSDFYDDLNAWVSAVSDETSATTDASNRVIWIHHDDDVSGSEDTITIRTESSGDYKMTDSSGNLQRHFPQVRDVRSNHYCGVRTDNTSDYDRYTMTTSVIASLTIGEKLTGGTSNATALVVSDPAGGTTFYVWTITGTFSAGETLTGSISGVVGTFTSLSSKNGIVIEDYSSANPYIFPVFDAGLPCLQAYSDDTNDPVTPQDVYEWFIDNGKSQYCDGISLFQDDSYMTANGKNLCNFFRWRFSIYTQNFKIPGGTVISQALAKHMFRAGEFTMGEIDSNGVTTLGAGIIGAWHLAYYNTLARQGGSQIKIYGSIMGMATPNGSSCDRDPYYQITYGPAVIRDSIIKSSGRWNPSLDVKNSRLMISGEIGDSSDANTNVTENVTWNAFIGGTYSIQEVTFKDSIIAGTSSYVFFLDSYYISGGCRCINANNMIYDYSLFTYLARLRHATAGSDNVIRFSNSIKIKVIDKNGNIIEGAKIYATDVDGEKGLFNENWVARTYTNAGKTGTSITINSGSVSVGSYYRAGDEVIKIVSGTAPNYIIARAQNNSTANNIGGVSSARTSYLYLLNDYLETDSNGEANLLLNYKYYKSLDGTSGGFYIDESDLINRGPFDIKIQKDGYEIYTMKYNPIEKKDEVIELKDAIDVMITNKGIGIRADKTNSTKDRDLIIIP